MQKKNELVILALFLLNLFAWLIWSELTYGFPTIIKYVFSLIALVILIIYWLTNPSKPITGKIFYPFIILFIAWSAKLLISLILNPYSEFSAGLSLIQRILGQSWFFLPYIIPLFLLYSKFDLDFFVRLFQFSSILIIPAVLTQIYIIVSGVIVGNDNEQQSRVMIFDVSCGFLLLTTHMSRKKYIFNIVFLYYLLMIFLLTQWGRRAIFIDSILVVSAMIYMRLKSQLLKFNDRIKIYFAGLIIVIAILTFGHKTMSIYIFQRGFSKEAFEASRSNVYEGFFLDFNKPSDWIFGRGIGGSVLRTTDSTRYVDFIESGFLILLFKGGLLYLIPTLIILLRAIYLGLRMSNNDFVKALAFLILIYIFSMFASNYPEFSSKYVFLWISASACFTPELRNASNEEIYLKINSWNIT